MEINDNTNLDKILQLAYIPFWKKFRANEAEDKKAYFPNSVLQFGTANRIWSCEQGGGPHHISGEYKYPNERIQDPEWLYKYKFAKDGSHEMASQLGRQMAERLGNRAINQKVAGLIPGP